MATPVLSNTVKAYKALGHPARVRVVAMLRAGELCACQITAVLRLAPSTVSAHLAELRRAELIVERRAGRWIHYSLAHSAAAQEIVAGMWPRVRRDPQIRADATLVKQLRAVSVEDLCRADLDLARLAIEAG